MQPGNTNMGRSHVTRADVILGGILIVLVMLISPSFVAASVLGLIGFACARSALVHRQTGWLYGFVFGLVLIAVVIGGLCVSVYYLLTT